MNTDSAAQLLQLSKLIQDSVVNLTHICYSNGVALPNISDQIFTPSSEEFRALEGASLAVDTIVAAASQLIAAVMPPHANIAVNVAGHLGTAAMRVCVEANVTEILREAGPEGLHISEISKKAKLDAGKLGGMIRYLAVRHMYREVTPDVFTNTRLSSTLDTGKSVKAIQADPSAKHDGTAGYAALCSTVFDVSSKSAGYLWEAISDPATGGSGEVEHSAFNKAFETDKSFWDFIQTPEEAWRGKRFGIAMQGVLAAQPARQIFKAFDWESLPNGAVVVDVGGGVGASSLELAREFNELNFVVQDSPPVIAEAAKLWSAQLPDALVSTRARLQAHDFFTRQTVRGASVFLLSQILHDWSDKYCVKILARLREAAEPDTKLVVVEHVLQNACSVPDGEAWMVPGAVPRDAPAPLLANYGIASGISYMNDLGVLVLVNAQERTAKQYMELLGRAGWRMVEIKNTGGARHSVIAAPIL